MNAISDIKGLTKIKKRAVLNLVIDKAHHEKFKIRMPSSTFFQNYNKIYQKPVIRACHINDVFNRAPYIAEFLIRGVSDPQVLDKALAPLSDDTISITHPQNQQAIKLLIKCGADINKVPLLVEKGVCQDSPEMVRYFLDNGFDIAKAKGLFDIHRKRLIEEKKTSQLEEWKNLEKDVMEDYSLDAAAKMFQDAEKEASAS